VTGLVALIAAPIAGLALALQADVPQLRIAE